MAEQESIILDPGARKPPELRTSTQDLKSQLMKIDYQIAQFNECWPQLVVHAEAFVIPIYESDPESNKPIIPQVIAPIEHLKGDAAIEIMKKALGRFDVGDKVQNKSSVYRLPSLAILNSLEPVIDMINLINHEKDILREMLAEHPPGSRRKVAREAFPGKVMLQIYRHINAFDFDVEKLTFSWATQGTSFKALTLKKAIDFVESKRDSLSSKLSPDSKDQIVEDLINKLIKTRSNHFKIRRKLAPTPRLKAFPYDCDAIGKLDAETLINSNIPAFVGCLHDVGNGNELIIPQVKPLLPVHPKAGETRQRRSKLTLIEPNLDLYLVEN